MFAACVHLSEMTCRTKPPRRVKREHSLYIKKRKKMFIFPRKIAAERSSSAGGKMLLESVCVKTIFLNEDVETLSLKERRVNKAPTMRCSPQPLCSIKIIVPHSRWNVIIAYWRRVRFNSPWWIPDICIVYITVCLLWCPQRTGLLSTRLHASNVCVHRSAARPLPA